MLRGDQGEAIEAFEAALRLFETDTVPSVDHRPFVHQLLTLLRGPSVSAVPEPSMKSPQVSGEAHAEQLRYVRQVFDQGERMMTQRDSSAS